MAEMEMLHCILCGYPFYGKYRASCDYCRPREVQMYTATKDFLVDHPLANFEDITRELGVPRNLVEIWMEECRIELKDRSPLTIPCKKCGRPIHFGKLCVNCRPPFVTMREEFEAKIRDGQGFYFSKLKKDPS